MRDLQGGLRAVDEKENLLEGLREQTGAIQLSTRVRQLRAKSMKYESSG